jgi:SSS family solute:Na+ symporter
MMSGFTLPSAEGPTEEKLAFIFFGVLVGCNGVWLWSNATSSKKDPKALPIDLGIFTTTRGYTWGTIGICVITLILYAVLW